MWLPVCLASFLFFDLPGVIFVLFIFNLYLLASFLVGPLIILNFLKAKRAKGDRILNYLKNHFYTHEKEIPKIYVTDREIGGIYLIDSLILRPSVVISSSLLLHARNEEKEVIAKKIIESFYSTGPAVNFMALWQTFFITIPLELLYNRGHIYLAPILSFILFPLKSFGEIVQRWDSRNMEGRLVGVEEWDNVLSSLSRIPKLRDLGYRRLFDTINIVKT